MLNLYRRSHPYNMNFLTYSELSTTKLQDVYLLSKHHQWYPKYIPNQRHCYQYHNQLIIS